MEAEALLLLQEIRTFEEVVVLFEVVEETEEEVAEVIDFNWIFRSLKLK